MIDPRNYEPYAVSVEEYRRFRADGFLIVRHLAPPEDIAELREHTEELMQGRLPEQRDGTVDAPPSNLPPTEKAQHLLRIHMLHRKLALHERYLLHPRVLDVVQALIGPDVLALQTMLFLKPPGGAGQGWHQDTYYIPTHPDTLLGAWIALDDADEFNGGMWMATGSQREPIYPAQVDPLIVRRESVLPDVPHIKGASNPDDAQNDLAQVADRYPQVLASVRPGDVVFFGGHVLHRSKQNITTDRFRRSFVSHYCNARSFTQWGAVTESRNPHSAPTIDPETRMTNASHILARGDTHLPFAQPRFGTFCAAILPAEKRRHTLDVASAMMADDDMVEAKPADPHIEHDDYPETSSPMALKK